jgi:hypothetical protein
LSLLPVLIALVCESEMESTYSCISTLPALEAVFHNLSGNTQVKELIFELCDTTLMVLDISVVSMMDRRAKEWDRETGEGVKTSAP